MGCCGQKRETLRSTLTQKTMPPGTQPGSESSPPPAVGRQAQGRPVIATSSSAVILHYLERSHILVRGPATGRQYEFSGSYPHQSVDVRDAEALLRTRFFRKA